MAGFRTLGQPVLIGVAAMMMTAAPALADDAGSTPAPTVGVPHLSSPENLPPGTVSTPPPDSGGRMGYLQDLWQAVQAHQLTGRNALLLLAQMPLDAPAQGLPASPQAPPSAPSPPDGPALSPAPGVTPGPASAPAS
ncbi:MAG TPA: dopamine receptor D4 [Mycobacterium sp.]|nr:dopamine receptor D4 [Mycobacterium sp.]